MCGGASKVLVDSLDLPTDIESRMKTYGLYTAQDVIDEGREGLRRIGISSGNVSIVSERIQKETGQQIE